MKKLIFTIVFLLFAIPVGAQNGDIIGEIYSTDILAVLDKKPAPSYNIGGRTAVVLEELSEFFNNVYIDYDDAARTLKVNISGFAGGYGNEVLRGTPGKTLGHVYESDIRVIVNGHEINGINIGGKTAVVIEDLGEIGGDNEKFGYSKYRYTYTWNETERTIALDYIDIGLTFYSVKKTPYTEFFINDDVISASFDRMNDYFPNLCETNLSDEFMSETEVLKPLYYEDGTEVGMMYISDSGEPEYYITNAELLREKTDELVTKTPSADEVLKGFDDKVKYETTDIAELDDYYVIDVICLDDSEKIYETEYQKRYFIAVKKSGGYMVLWNLSTFYDKSYFEKTDKNSVSLYIKPFAGPHGADTMRCDFNFDDYEIL